MELVSTTQPRVVSVGECMIELSRPGQTAVPGDGWRVGFGGDCFNTAVYLRRLGLPVSFLTALGADPFSEALRAAWQTEGIDLSLVLRDPTRMAGLYAIRTDEQGERSFFYWRSDSAARQMLRLPGIEQALASAEQADLLYLSGITLSILPEEDRPRLAALAGTVQRRGGLVAFDPNYRARAWPDVSMARRCIAALSGLVRIVLPTLDDERALWSDADADPAATASRWHAMGATEVVVKSGGAGAWVSTGGNLTHVPSPPVGGIVDTTGAGDSFNAAYLAARLRGAAPAEAALAGHALAAQVIQHPGALLERQRPRHQ